MLPKTKRLTSAIQKEVFEKGRSVFGTTTSLVYLKGDSENPTRFGFSLSKKSVKTAPKRNSIKRKGYESIRKVSGNINKGYFAVFVIKKDISKEPLTFFIENVGELIKKSPLFKN